MNVMGISPRTNILLPLSGAQRLGKQAEPVTILPSDIRPVNSKIQATNEHGDTFSVSSKPVPQNSVYYGAVKEPKASMDAPTSIFASFGSSMQNMFGLKV
jgi:hypothetical protein